MENTHSQIVIYKDQKGNIKIDVRFDGDTVWLTQKMMSLLFQVSVPTINEHIKNIVNEGETDGSATIRKFRIVQKEGSRDVEREVEYYNLDLIIAVGYRVKSSQGTAFRKWATERLSKYIVKRLVIVMGHITQLVEDKYIYDKFREYLKTHGITDMHRSGDFLRFVVNNYRDIAIINVYKQVDKDRCSESLINLLKSIKENSNLFNKKWYMDVKGEFKDCFNKRTNKLRKTAVDKDIKELIRIVGNYSRKMEKPHDSLIKLRNKQKAHADKSGFQSKLVFNDLDRAIVILEKIVLKYQVIVTGDGQDNLRTVNIDDYLRFDTLFRSKASKV